MPTLLDPYNPPVLTGIFNSIETLCGYIGPSTNPTEIPITAPVTNNYSVLFNQSGLFFNFVKVDSTGKPLPDEKITYGVWQKVYGPCTNFLGWQCYIVSNKNNNRLFHLQPTSVTSNIVQSYTATFTQEGWNTNPPNEAQSPLVGQVNSVRKS